MADSTAQVPDSALVAAANWWRGALVRPKFDALGKHRDLSMEFAQFMLSATHRPLTDAQLDGFRDALLGRLRGLDVPALFYSLAVDYGPTPVLSDSAAGAGISVEPSTFPIKTVMWIRPTHVSVRHGYGAGIEVIWGEEPQSEETHG